MDHCLHRWTATINRKKMKRTLAIGDIHGGLRALKQLLEKIKITANDRLIFMGDLVDGWSESFELIEYLIVLKEKQECIFIKGNHDLYCEYWLRTAERNPSWDQHGGLGTQEGYRDSSEEVKQQHIEFFQQMTFYHIDESNRLYIHAGFTSLKGPIHEHHESNYIWDRTLLEMAIAADPTLDPSSIRYPKRLKQFHEIFIGHTPTQNYGQDTPINALNLWDVDTGAAFKGRLTAMDVETKEYWQSDPVYTLYPEEMGRNKA